MPTVTLLKCERGLSHGKKDLELVALQVRCQRAKASSQVHTLKCGLATPQATTTTDSAHLTCGSSAIRGTKRQLHPAPASDCLVPGSLELRWGCRELSSVKFK